MLFAGFLINLCYFNVKDGFLQKNIKNDFQEEKQGIQTGGMNGN